MLPELSPPTLRKERGRMGHHSPTSAHERSRLYASTPNFANSWRSCSAFFILLALLVVPRVAEQHAADVPEKSADSCQGHSPMLLWVRGISYRLWDGPSIATAHERRHSRLHVKSPDPARQDRGGLNCSFG
jgi:hypothetical protein